MRRCKLGEIVQQPEIQQLYAPLYERHVRSIDLIKKRAQTGDGVVFFDLIGDNLEGYNKFIPYYLFPNSTYTVSVSTSSFRTKVSVGSNPWATAAGRAQPGHHLRALRRRWTSAGGRYQLRDRRRRQGPRGGSGDPPRAGELIRVT